MTAPDQAEDAPLTPEELARYERQGEYIAWERERQRRREQAEGSQ
ncbi:hypothetical protein [Nocardiopsis dassonvillei]|nr:hypothetical protein [Nocardiopsis dassonvillei]